MTKTRWAVLAASFVAWFAAWAAMIYGYQMVARAVAEHLDKVDAHIAKHAERDTE